MDSKKALGDLISNGAVLASDKMATKFRGYLAGVEAATSKAKAARDAMHQARKEMVQTYAKANALLDMLHDEHGESLKKEIAAHQEAFKVSSSDSE